MARFTASAVDCPKTPPVHFAPSLRDPSALAQLVEQLTVNQRVAGSSPAGGAKYRKAALCAAFFCPHRCAFPSKSPTLSLSQKTFVPLLRSGKIGIQTSANNVSNSNGRYIHPLIGVTAMWERPEIQMES